MKLETFDDVLTSIRKNPRRQFHLLLGNGFSVSYDPKIFSYNALHEFVKNLKDKDLSKILEVIETRNFEVIMQYLDSHRPLRALMLTRRLCGLAWVSGCQSGAARWFSGIDVKARST